MADFITGDEPFQMLALGGMPGEPYRAPGITELAPEPARTY